MIRLGKFFFRYRNILGPAVFLSAVALSHPHYPLGSSAWNVVFDCAGIFLAIVGQIIRAMTVGYDYIVRGGRQGRVYAKHIVQGGMFGHCRNPLYLANLLIALGLALVLNAYAFYVIVIPTIAFAYRCIVAAEEDYLQRNFGSEYEDYANRVNRWMPRLTGVRKSLQGMQFNWQRVVVKEYSTTFLLVPAIACLWLWSEYVVRGETALPSARALSITATIWVLCYLFVRELKKRRYIVG